MQGAVLELYNIAQASRENLRKAVAVIPEDRSDWKPNSQASSAVEILRYLCAWEDYFVSILDFIRGLTSEQQPLPHPPVTKVT